MKMNFKQTVSLCLVGLLFFSFTLPASAAIRTQTGYKETGKNAVETFPYIRFDKKAIYIDFQSSKFNQIEYIYYNLNYDSDEEGTIRGLEGLIVPDSHQTYRYYNNIPYIRRELTFGTCSKNVCNYDKNPRKVNITVKTKLKNIKGEQTKVVSIDY